MKLSHKIALVSSTIVILALSLLSFIQYRNVSDALYNNMARNVSDSSKILGNQITNWLNGKLRLVDLMSEQISADFSRETIQRTFDAPLLQREFDLVFGGLDSDGKAITNDPEWNTDGWDARARPWYPYAKGNKQAVLTAPYTDFDSGDILISVVANLYDKGKFMGAFGGDLSLKTVSDALNTLNFNNTGYAFLVSADGNIISHPDAKLNGKPVSELFGTKPALKSTLQEVAVRETSVFTAFHPLKGLSGSNWLIGVVLDKEKVLADAAQFGWLALIGTLITALLTSVILYLTLVGQLKPLRELSASLREINSGNGDLTRRLNISSSAELSQVSQEFNQFLEFLQTLIQHIKSISQNVRSNTGMTAESATHAAQSLEKQLYELDQLATAMHEMSATAHEVAGSAQQAADAASDAEQAAEDGAHIVNQTTGSIDSLARDMEDVVHTINALSGYSNNIASILTVITDIAEQTNLLALNAAIEAARAGEQGRGFAVVADEVRALASRTQKSTDEIRAMIDQLQTGVGSAEAVILSCRNKASDTSSLGAKADTALSTIRERIQQINLMTVQIATAAEEQSATAEEINRNTTNIRDISRSVADSAQEQKQNCAQMNELTAQQDSELNRFKV
ncbi:methyl-accepting chemotaxis protein [Marinobacterium sp. D7]|uniref:methyl-accepting chemotaxis protein n=1 Tax=Marinobacterium ramblicola TaxID=2849041 RepID=UPI001C2D1A02|nr:methyl-accepting chemotaxis protein [Marinobacterium ramblicola]MBV1787998.1 methyl-accepting chemotaxis protein [Marinobacterium ramblicola]